MQYYSDGTQTQTIRYDDDSRSDNQPVYIGFAEMGVGESDLKWTLHKFTYDGDNVPTSRKIYIGAWSKRTTYTFV